MIELSKYSKFVQEGTSAESEFTGSMIDRLLELEDRGINSALLLTGALGLSAEAGEFTEIVKKVVFQGKDIDRQHLKRELGDIIWYWVNACRALSLDPNDVIEENISKLKARYPSGKFVTFHSENRAADDL
jgi:NTP pyrophosphatase (non-canonical NTP hydrolase)